MTSIEVSAASTRWLSQAQSAATAKPCRRFTSRHASNARTFGRRGERSGAVRARVFRGGSTESERAVWLTRAPG